MEWLALMPNALDGKCAVSAARKILWSHADRLEHELDLSEGHAAAASDWCTA